MGGTSPARCRVPRLCSVLCVGKGVSEGVIGDSRKDLIRDWQSRINLQVELRVEKCQNRATKACVLWHFKRQGVSLNILACLVAIRSDRAASPVVLWVYQCFLGGQGIREVTLLGG